MNKSWKDTLDTRNIALDALVKAGVVDQPTSPIMNLDQQKIVMIIGAAIENAIAAAVQQEREACAIIADEHDYMKAFQGNEAVHIAAAIRARNEANHDA